LAPKAVVIAKRNALRPEVVGAANDEHSDWSEAVQRYINAPSRTVAFAFVGALSGNCGAWR
jgi:hypothetical protein